MPLDPATTVGCDLGQPLLAMTADLWDDHHHLDHLLNRQRHAEHAPVAGLAASVAS